jgi:hypothetical protein
VLIQSLVAVHGLGSRPETAWAYEKASAPEAIDGAACEHPGQTTGPIWLRDFLPRDELNVRVIVYYHNSGWQSNALGMELSDYGRDLLQQLERLRRTDEVSRFRFHERSRTE